MFTILSIHYSATEFNKGNRQPCFLRVHNPVEKDGQALRGWQIQYIKPTPICYLLLSQCNTFLHGVVVFFFFPFLVEKNRKSRSNIFKMLTTFQNKAKEIKANERQRFILTNFKYQFKSKFKILKVLITEKNFLTMCGNGC